MNNFIPLDIDALEILNDLNRLGWRDAKIELVCGFSSGYVSQIRCGNIKLLSYQRAARLHNFWLEETGRAPPMPSAVPATT